MRFAIYIAFRYLVSRKSHNIIHLISMISVTGVAIGAMALIIVLSVFNGFDRLVVSLFSTFNAPLQVTPARGKTFRLDSFPVGQIRNIRGVSVVADVIEEEALMKYKDNQAIVTLKGVGEAYPQISGLDSMVVDGDFLLRDGEKAYAVLGYGVAAALNANLRDFTSPLVVYVPDREASFSGGLESGFRSDALFPSGFFQVQYEYDVRYVLVPVEFAAALTGGGWERTSLEIGLDPGADPAEVGKQVARIAGSDFVIKNRYQQQEILYRIMVSEKRYIFLILTLILIIASFNVIGTLTMLILDKRRDIHTLSSLGAGKPMIRTIFLLEGMLISLIGAVAGLTLGALICWAQMKFGLIRLGSDDSSFVVSAYPVHMQASDFLLVFFTVMIIGFAAAWYPVFHLKRAYAGDVRPL